jgi:hypothetical protein
LFGALDFAINVVRSCRSLRGQNVSHFELNYGT